MRKKDIYRIINEEIAKFDFLNNEALMKETENIDLLKERNFQRSLIVDSITNMREKIKLVNPSEAYISEPDIDERTDRIDFQCSFELSYLYNNNPVLVTLDFLNDNLGISINGYSDPGDGYLQPPDGEIWIDGVDWNSIKVHLYTPDADEIPFTELENASVKTRELFIRAYCEDIIENETNMAVTEKRPQFTSINHQ